MKIAQLVAAVIACNSNPFGKDHEPTLLTMNAEQLTPLIKDEKLKANCACDGKVPPAEPVVPVVPPVEVPATNAGDLPITMNQLQTMLTDTLPGLIGKAVEAHGVQDSRSKLVAELKANAACSVPDEGLDGLDLNVLEGIARSCGVVVDYSGNGGPRTNSLDDAEENAPPEMATVDWSKGA